MITSINVKQVATFDDTGIEIANCQKVNFIYGANGSGKTTISSFLDKQEDPKYHACSVQWDSKGPLPILVYNKSFREKNFGKADIAGIFTLGEATKEQISAIEKKKEELEKLKDQASQKKITISKQEEIRATKDNEFQELVWKEILKKNESTFREAFTGCLNKKQAFKEKLLQAYSGNNQVIPDRDELVKNSMVLFGSTPVRLEILPFIDGSELTKIENDAIWSKKIIGKQDVNIAKLIQTLNIGDWVNEGRKFIKDDGVCPFCQQKTITDKFRSELEDYFSGEYEEDTKHLANLQTTYNLLVEKISHYLAEIESSEKSNPHSQLDINAVSQSSSALINLLNANQILISQKLKEPSRIIKLTTSTSLLSELSRFIREANAKIAKNNKLVENYTSERASLISNIWSLLINENKALIDSYMRNDSGLLKGINELTGQLKKLNEDIRKLSAEIIEDSKNVTSVQPSVDEMNKILSSYDFNGFRIVPSNTKNHYQIQREDGTLANDTLSEGEITFITFLYYLQLVKGGTSTDNITDNRVVVVDDPISSLDSNVLFVVSSLLKKIIESIKADEGNIKQIFIFTHNVYFHKEASFINGRIKENKDTYYWVLKKVSNKSSVKCYDIKNPISTSYELLWRELKENSNASSITIQNIMRRIIENYFKILGGYGDEDLIEKFPEQDREICRSLLCWINDGSHCIPDNLYVDSHDDTSEKFFKVFKNIFKNTGHEQHYEMMMNSIGA